MVDVSLKQKLEFTAPSLTSSGTPATLKIGQTPGPNQFTANGAATSQSGFKAPVGIGLDASGDLWVADRANNRILGFKPPFADGMNASFQVGQSAGPAQFTTGLAGLSQDSLHNPLGITFDPSGNLWVADQANGRVLEFDGYAAATAAAAAVASGGTAAADETSTTGLKMTMTGMPSGSAVNFYSAVLESQPPNTGTPALASPLVFYHAKVSGQGGGTATLCVAGSHVSSSTTIMFYDGAKWIEPSGINMTTGVSICGGFPTSAIGSLTLLAVGTASAAAPSFPTLQVSVALLAAAAAFGAITYVVIMRRRRR